MMYPIDKCYFCGDKLDANDIRLNRCVYSSCCGKYRYRYWVEDSMIEFTMGNYLFEIIYAVDDSSDDEMVIWKRSSGTTYDYILTGPVMQVTKDNYMDIVNRFEKLNVFK